MEIEIFAEKLCLAVWVDKTCLNSDLVHAYQNVGHLFAIDDEGMSQRIVSRKQTCFSHPQFHSVLGAEEIGVLSKDIREGVALSHILVFEGGHPFGDHAENVDTGRRWPHDCHSERVFQLDYWSIGIGVQGGPIPELVGADGPRVFLFEDFENPGVCGSRWGGEECRINPTSVFIDKLKVDCPAVRIDIKLEKGIKLLGNLWPS